MKNKNPFLILFDCAMYKIQSDHIKEGKSDETNRNNNSL